MKVFTVMHTIVRSPVDSDDKQIGVFSSEERAKEAIEQVKDLPGFKDPRGAFRIEPSELDIDQFDRDPAFRKRG